MNDNTVVFTREILEFLRRNAAKLIGSAGLGLPAHDFDFLICVNEDFQSVIQWLTEHGFSSCTPSPKTTDPLVACAFQCGMVDIQLATPQNYEEKLSIFQRVSRLPRRLLATKEQRYALYRQLAGGD